MSTNFYSLQIFSCILTFSNFIETFHAGKLFEFHSTEKLFLGYNVIKFRSFSLLTHQLRWFSHKLHRKVPGNLHLSQKFLFLFNQKFVLQQMRAILISQFPSRFRVTPKRIKKIICFATRKSSTFHRNLFLHPEVFLLWWFKRGNGREKWKQK